ncbi:MAG: NYN domain-containing protein [Acidimicrobiales bacterium]
MGTIVYVDGFNLYYGALKGTGFRWLDLEAFCRAELSQEQITEIRYFTARVSGKLDRDAPVRQNQYLRALATQPTIRVHYGNFLSNVTRMPLAEPLPGGPRTVQVIKTEEKGSDVNLASYLLWDAFSGRCHTQVLVSNDSDFCEPLRICHEECHMRVGVLNPHPKIRRSKSLNSHADFSKQISVTALGASQFSDPVIHIGHRPITKPTTW